MKRFGRNDLENIATMLADKTLTDITKYHAAFWNRGPSEMQDFERYIAPIKKQEALANKEKTISQVLEWKMQCYRNPETDLTIKYITKSHYTREQDAFLLMSLLKYEINSPNVYGCIRQDVLYVDVYFQNFYSISIPI